MVWRSGQSYSQDLRDRVLGAVDSGMTATSTVTLTPAQLSMLLEGIDWRRPERTFTPTLAG